MSYILYMTMIFVHCTMYIAHLIILLPYNNRIRCTAHDFNTVESWFTAYNWLWSRTIYPQHTVFSIGWPLYTVLITLYSVHHTMYTIQCTSYNIIYDMRHMIYVQYIRRTLYGDILHLYHMTHVIYCIVRRKLYGTVYIVHCASAHSTVYIVHCIVYSVHCTLYTE